MQHGGRYADRTELLTERGDLLSQLVELELLVGDLRQRESEEVWGEGWLTANVIQYVGRFECGCAHLMGLLGL